MGFELRNEGLKIISPQKFPVHQEEHRTNFNLFSGQLSRKGRFLEAFCSASR
jgi:hypothetical protein